MQTILQDLRYALRLLVRTPAVSVVAVLTLALGIGANTAIFTVVNAMLFRPLPYAEPSRLVMVWQDLRATGGPRDEWASPGNFTDWRNARSIFEDVAAIGGWRPTLTGGAEPEPLAGEQVSHEYFRILGATPALGRDFRAEDDVPNARRVAIISDALWKRRFGGDGSVIGRTVSLAGEPHEIIGVLPTGVRPIVNAAAQVWRPYRLNTANPSRGAVVLRVIGKLTSGLDIDGAQVAASAMARQLQVQYPEFNEKVDFFVQPLLDRVVGDIRPGLMALLGAVAFVLLIACVNIANLLLARGSSRGRELAVRSALGAARGRVVRQLLTESLLLAVIGGIAGVLLGVWAVDGLVALAPADAPRIQEIGLDLRVFAFAAVMTLMTGLLFGLAPALQASRSRLSGSLKDGARGASAVAGRSLRRTLIAAEVALALMLLTGGGLLLQTFVKLQRADLGFDPHNVLVGAINLPRTTYSTTDKQRAFLQQALEKATALPGVQHAALSSIIPFGGDSDTSFEIEGRSAPASRADQPVTWYRIVSADYFASMGMRVVRGHAVAAGDQLPSVVVNETFARRFFASEEPIGRRVRASSNGPWFTIVGISGDIRAQGARREVRAEMFIPYWQYLEPGGSGIILKSGSNPAALVAPLKAAVASLDPDVPVSNIAMMSDMVAESIDQPRFFAILAGAFALLALVLAAVGIYGVMAYVVSQRTTEIGVRMALGATGSEVFRLVLGDGLRVTAVGIVVGIAGSVLVGRWLTSLLYGVGATDPLTLTATAGVLLLVAAAACFIPARRATRVDPMVALRAD